MGWDSNIAWALYSHKSFFKYHLRVLDNIPFWFAAMLIQLAINGFWLPKLSRLIAESGFSPFSGKAGLHGISRCDTASFSGRTCSSLWEYYSRTASWRTRISYIFLIPLPLSLLILLFLSQLFALFSKNIRFSSIYKESLRFSFKRR
jgi:hypothetical protein